jgi:signal transduction histidine kinase/ActR/RegA family two-component response regulator
MTEAQTFPFDTATEPKPARPRLFPVRAAYAAAATLFVAVLSGPIWAAVVLAAWAAGEVAALICAALAPRIGRAGPALAGLGAPLWAVGAAGAIAAIWLGDGAAPRLLALVFLAAAAVGAWVSFPPHRVGASAWAAQAVLAATLAGLIAADGLRDPAALQTVAAIGLSGLVLASTLGGMFWRWHHQDRDRADRAAQLRAALERQATADAALRAAETTLDQNAETMRELSRKAEAAAAAKSDFLAVMSHEIRTPMNAILGTVELMADRERDREDRDHLATIERAARSLLAVIDDVLDFSRIEAGQMAFNSERFAPAKVVEDIAAMFRPIQEAKGLDFRTQGLEALPTALLGDSKRIRQILVNLVGNAMKFTEQGEVRVEAGYAAEDYTAELRFDVVDTGPGMTEAEIERIFAPFERLEPGMKRENGGTGLGLAISRRLAESMGGALEVESTPGAGSRFILKLPLIEAPAEERALDTEGFGSEAPNFAGVRILIAEDNATNRLILDRFLAPTGATLSVAEDGGAAVGLYAAGAPDLVLMDMSMPVKTGLEATEEIRTLEGREGRRRCPIVALTANALADDREACIAAGMDGFLAKPLKRAELFAACRDALDAAEAADPAPPARRAAG